MNTPFFKVSNKSKENAGDKDCKRAMFVNHYVKEQMDLFASAEPGIIWEFNNALTEYETLAGIGESCKRQFGF